jgi:L-Ala-D/L-Glu epimerase
MIPQPGRDRHVASFDTSLIDVELTEPFAISTGAPAAAQNVLVRVTLESGATGYGEAAPFEAVSGETQLRTLAALRSVETEMIGRDAAGWRGLATDLRTLLPREPAARCAAEQAVIDALARHVGLPLWAFFGGSPRQITTDITIPAGDVAHSAESARRAVQSGFAVVKVKIGASDWATDVARVVAVSRAAPDAIITVDANAAYSREQAHKFVAGAIEAGVRLGLVEQPVVAEDITGLAILEQDFGVPVCADESVRSPADAILVARTGGISVINVKLMKCGVADALDIISVARSAGMTCMIGGMIETSVSMSFSAALAAANFPLFDHVDLDTPLFMPPGLIDGGMDYNGRLISLPCESPGTGVDASSHFMS